MRIIKLGLISFIFIFLVVTLISLLIPSHIRISRAVNLPNRRDSIFALVKDEKRWHPAYHDSAALSYMNGLQKTITAQSDSTFVYTLQQQGRKPVINGWQLYGAPSSDSLTLQWYMDFHLGWYPWEKFSSLFYERTYGMMMENGLANLKKGMRQ
jgi:hypothetical protein